MNMKKIILLIVIVLAAFLAGAQDTNYADCLVKTDTKWGAVCEKCEYYTEGYKRDYSGTFQLEMKNACSVMVEVKIAMEEENGSWRTFPIRALEPQESTAVFACHGSGKYLYWVRRVDDTEIILPSAHDILTAYAAK